MLNIKCIMNSAVEDILAFKTCCGLKMFDQNLEIHLTNQGTRSADGAQLLRPGNSRGNETDCNP